MTPRQKASEKQCYNNPLMQTHLLLAIIKSIRPAQWLKNVVLFAPLLISGLLFSISPHNGLPYIVSVLYAFVIFCLLSSSIYLFNDVVDKNADAAHPFKKKRPIASGQVSVKLALTISVVGIILVAILSLPLGYFFKVLIACYVILQISYTSKLKHIPIIDVFTIASAFIIRVYAGATVCYLRLNSWFLLTVISAALFIAVGKRQSERTLIADLSVNLGKTRSTLRHYSQRLLDQYTSIFATSTWMSYAFFTFQYQYTHPDQNLSLLYHNLPQIIRPEKLLMFTIPLAILGVMRYLQLIYEHNQGESPARVLLEDSFLRHIMLVFVLAVLAIIYGIPALNDAAQAYPWLQVLSKPIYL